MALFLQPETVAGLYGCAVAVAVRDPARPSPPLLHGEEAAVSNARPARKHEFAAGRAAAREALAELGHLPEPILMGPDRCPVWPDGIAGSIAHTRTVCAAVVSTDPSIRSVGLDIEDSGPLEAELIGDIADSVEAAWVAADPNRRGKLLFVIKEAAYKSLYPLQRQFLDFTDVHIDVDMSASTFTAGPGGRQFDERVDGRFHVSDSHVIAAAWVSASQGC